MLAPLLHLALVLVLSLLYAPCLSTATAAPSNCLPTAPFNVSLPPDFQLQSDLYFSPFSCSLIVLTSPYTVYALSSIDGQPRFQWPFPVDYNYSYPSETFHLSATNDRLYTLTISTDPDYDEACTNVIALSTSTGKVAWTQSICVTPAPDAEPYANGDYVVVGNMSRTAAGGVLDYVVHISSSASMNRTTGEPVSENYSVAVYGSETGAVLSVLDMGAVCPLALRLLSVQLDNSALLMMVAGVEDEYEFELLYSLDVSGRLTYIRNISADRNLAWQDRYYSSPLVYMAEDCDMNNAYIGVDAVSREVLWQVRDVRLDGFHWFGDTLPGYTNIGAAHWWPEPRDAAPRFLASTLLYITNQATKPDPTTNRTLLVVQHAIYNLSTGNYTALPQLLGPVESSLGDLYPGADLELTRDGQPVLILEDEYFVLDGVTLAVVEHGVMPSVLDGLRCARWQEWRGQHDSWIWSMSFDKGPQWVAATFVERNASVATSTRSTSSAALSQR